MPVEQLSKSACHARVALALPRLTHSLTLYRVAARSRTSVSAPAHAPRAHAPSRSTRDAAVHSGASAVPSSRG